MRGGRARIALLAFLAAAATAVSADAEDPPLPPGRAPEWAVAAGYGFSVRLNSGHAEEHLALLEPSVSFRLSARLEWVAAAHFARYFTPEGSMLGIVPLGLRLYAGNGPILPYVSIGAGGGWANLSALEEIDRRFNFILQGGVGVRGALDGAGAKAWTLEARLSHYSNAGTVPPNLGLNAVVLLAGARF